MTRTVNTMSDIFEEYAELARRYKAGDEAAFGEIYDKSSRFVYATCLGVLGNPEDASDAMQETYLAVYKNIDSLADEKKLLGWIKRIAVTKATDMLRKKKGETYYDDALASDEILEGDDDLESLPDYYIVEKTKRDTLHKLIRSALSDVQYQTVLFHYFDEMSVEEIANVMGCPIGTVKTRLKSSRILIKREVEKYEKDNDDRLAAFAGVPFLTGFFNAHAADISVPNIAPLIKEAVDAVTKSAKKTVSQATSATKTAASQASSVSQTAAAATESAKTGVAGFFATAAGKATAFIAASALIVGAVIGVTLTLKDKDKKDAEEEPTTTTEVTEEITDKPKAGDDDSFFDKIEDNISEIERAPAVEVAKDELPDYELLSSLSIWDLTGYDHTKPDEELYQRLFPTDTFPLVHFTDYDPDYKHSNDLTDPRGVFDQVHTHHIKAEAFYWMEKNVLALSDKDMEEFNKLLVPYEKDGDMAGAYIEGDTVWFAYPKRYDYTTRRNLKNLFDGEYYYIEYLIYDNYDWCHDPDYYRYEDGKYIFFVLQHKEVDGKGVWSIISTSDDPSTFPGEPAEIPTREADEEARQRAIENYH